MAKSLEYLYLLHIQQQMTHSNDGILEKLSIDCIILGFEDERLKVLLIERAMEPESGRWGLPGGFIMEKEDIDTASSRILQEMTGVKDIFMEQVAAFGAVDRYPLRRVVTLAYYAFVKPGNYKIDPGPEASQAKWFDVNEVPELVFDHPEILAATIERLQHKTRYEPIGFNLLPEKFTLLQLQKLYEAIHNTTFDKPNFRRKILNMNLLVQTEEWQTGAAHRAARLFRFDEERYEKLKKKGFIFEL